MLSLESALGADPCTVAFALPEAEEAAFVKTLLITRITRQKEDESVGLSPGNHIAVLAPCLDCEPLRNRAA